MRPAAIGLAAAGLGYAAERALMARVRYRTDPHSNDDFGLTPADVETTVATSDGGVIHVVERPGGGHVDAPAFLLLHGVTLSAATWRYQLDDLGSTHRVVAIDQRGHGRSTPGEAGFSFSRLAADVADVIDALDLHHVVLVGHSMGGMIAQRFVIEHPAMVCDRLDALVLASTSAGTGFGMPLWETVMALVTPPAQRGLRWLARRGVPYLPATDLSYLVARLALGRRASPTHVELTRAMSAATSLDTVADMAADIVLFDHTEALRHVRVPTMVVVGSRDLVTPVAQAKRLASAIPGATLAVVRGAGHMPMLEARSEFHHLLLQAAA